MSTTILIIIICLVIFIQTKTIISTLKKIRSYGAMYANNGNAYHLMYDEDDKDRIIGINSSDKQVVKNPYYANIQLSINKYLKNNSNEATDFHIIKDIVDRNTESVEDEISTQVPYPLYYGLIGTMLGIIIGVADLVWSGALESLLGVSGTNEVSGVDGITALLAGVAGAMIASAVGVALTTYGSYKLKDVCAKVEFNKNTFLTWAQAELLPELNTNFTDEINRMTGKLTSFNNTFSDNTRALQSALKEVRETTQGQAELLKAVKELNMVHLAEININAFNSLQKCTESMNNVLAVFNNSADYLREVAALNEKLDKSEERTKAMEEVARYFVEERSQLDKIKNLWNSTVDEVDKTFSDTLKNLSEHSKQQVDEAIKYESELYQDLKRVFNEQTEQIKSNMKVLDDVIGEVKQMAQVKTAMDDMKDAVRDQNAKLDKLANAIQELARRDVGASGGAVLMPSWIKYTAIGTCTLVCLASAAGIAAFVISIIR